MNDDGESTWPTPERVLAELAERERDARIKARYKGMAESAEQLRRNRRTAYEIAKRQDAQRTWRRRR